ncbi:hypothetical protein ACWFMI_23850 [Nocardiopsis terrae]|uniref:hypothetical protein n=1 Tax=Streptomyces sp. NPDC057554 TaxID=3350538 RepID=UPI0036923D38
MVLMAPEDADAVREVHRTYHQSGANRRNHWCNPNYKEALTRPKPCPCLHVCDDCRKGRCATDPRQCAEVWNTHWAGWRRMPRPETSLVLPGTDPDRSPGDICVWLSGCCGRYICKCPCQAAAAPAPTAVSEQLDLFGGTP